MKKLTFILSLLMVFATTAMAQETYEQIIFKTKVTACNESGVSGNEGGVDFIWDNNPKTFYHSDWGSTYEGHSEKKGGDGLQAFLVELPIVHTNITKITYAGRSDGKTSGWAKKVRIYAYTDETFPENFTKNLHELSYDKKQDLLKRENNEVLGEPAFDNNESPWEGNTNLKTANFENTISAKYILFIMDEGTDKWLTCSQFNIYENSTSIVEPHKPYYLKITNTGLEGDWYLDVNTRQESTRSYTIGRSEIPTPAYFQFNNGAWNINASQWPNKEFVSVDIWDANPLSNNPAEWDIVNNEDGTITLLQATYHDVAADGPHFDYCFLGKEDNSHKVYTNKNLQQALKIEIVELNDLDIAKENARNLLKKTGVGFPAVGGEARVALEKAMNAGDATVESINAAIDIYKATFDEAGEANNIVLPEAGKVYRIVSAIPGFANRNVQKAVYSQNTEVRWDDYDVNSMNQLWAVESFSADGAISIINVNDAMHPQTSDFDSTVRMKYVPNESSWDYLGEGQFRIKINKIQGIHAKDHDNGSGNGSNIINYNTDKNGASAWYLEEVEVTKEIVNKISNNLKSAYIESCLIKEKSAELETAINSAEAATSDYAGALKQLLTTLGNTDISYIDQAYVYMKSKNGGQYIYNNDNTNLKTSTGKTERSVLKLTKANEGTYYIQTDGGFYPQGVSMSGHTILGANKKEYTINHLTTSEHYVLRPTDATGDYQFWHQDGSSRVVGWSSDADNTQWSFEALSEEEIEKIYTVNITSDNTSSAITYNNDSYTGTKEVKQAGGFYMLDAAPNEIDFIATEAEEPMINVVCVNGKNISLNVGYNGENIYIIRCKKDNSYARYHNDCWLNDEKAENMLTYENNNCHYESLFFIEKGTEGYEGYYTIRPVAAPTLYVYNLATENQDSKVAVRKAPEDGTLTVNYYWKISSFGENSGNITPKDGDTFGWNKRGSNGGKNHIGYWQDHNHEEDNQWYVRTLDEEFIPHTIDDLVLGYPTYESVKEYIPYTEAVSAAGLNKLKPAKNATFDIVIPETGTYYTLQNEKSSKYMTGNSNGITLETDKKETESIFYVDEDNKLMSYKSGKYLYVYNRGYSEIGKEVAGVFSNINGGYKANVLGYSNYNSGDKKYYWVYGGGDTNNGNMDRGSGTTIPNGQGYNWKFTEVTTLPVTITSAGYATFFAPVETTIPANVNVKAYYTTDKGGDGFIQITEIESKVIPANTGVILAGAEGTYNFQITNTGATAINGNLLQGTAAATYITEDAYVLANGENGIGLYEAETKGQAEGTFLNNSHKAYLPKSALSEAAKASKALRFTFGSTTAVEDIETENGVKTIYDLSGRKLSEITAPGIYIINGKKVVIK